METFKKFNLLVLIALFACCFISCSSSDSDGEFDNEEVGEIVANLQGTWQFKQGTETIMGMTVSFSRSDLMSMKKQMEAAENTKIEIWDDELKFSGNKVNGVRYTVKDNNQLVINDVDVYDYITIYIKSVTSSRLVLREVFNLEGFDFTADMEYQKK